MAKVLSWRLNPSRWLNCREGSALLPVTLTPGLRTRQPWSRRLETWDLLGIEKSKGLEYLGHSTDVFPAPVLVLALGTQQ